MLARETVWATLREIPPPSPPAALIRSTSFKPRKRNFDTVARTQLFADSFKEGNWERAAMMLSATARLDFGKIKVVGASQGECGRFDLCECKDSLILRLHVRMRGRSVVDKDVVCPSD